MQARPPIFKKMPERPKGIIIWDFDRVLFDTDRFIRDKERVFQRNGISREAIRRAYETMYRSIKQTAGRPFSLAMLFGLLRSQKIKINEKKLRERIRLLLSQESYLDPQADRIIHRLKKTGFRHIILSFGSAPLQYNKIKIGCGRKFVKHFLKIVVTTKPKYTVIKKIIKANPAVPVFFIDDAKEHLDFVKKYLPGVSTFHYSKKHQLSKIMRFLTKKVNSRQQPAGRPQMPSRYKL